MTLTAKGIHSSHPDGRSAPAGLGTGPSTMPPHWPPGLPSGLREEAAATSSEATPGRSTSAHLLRVVTARPGLAGLLGARVQPRRVCGEGTTPWRGTKRGKRQSPHENETSGAEAHPPSAQQTRPQQTEELQALVETQTQQVHTLPLGSQLFPRWTLTVAVEGTCRTHGGTEAEGQRPWARSSRVTLGGHCASRARAPGCRGGCGGGLFRVKHGDPREHMAPAKRQAKVSSSWWRHLHDSEHTYHHGSPVRVLVRRRVSCLLPRIEPGIGFQNM